MKRFLSCFLGMSFAVGLLTAGSPAEAAKFRIGAHRALWGSWEVVAHRMGYFKEAGLDYSIQYFKQGKLMRNAIIQDNLDSGTTGGPPFVTAVSKNAKVSAIGVTANICGLMYIMVPVDSKAKSVKDLKGKTFADKKGTSTNLALKAKILPAHGMTENDLNWLSVNETERIAALSTGRAQGATVGDPMAEIAVQKGLIRRLHDFCSYTSIRMMHIGNPRTLREHPELYEKYFRGWLKAHKLLKENPEKFVKVYTKELQEIGQKAEYKVILPVMKRFRSEPLITDKVKNYLNEMGDLQLRVGWIKNHPDFTKSEFVDDSILRKVISKVGKRN